MSARELSFWGWGWADKFPDDETRKGLATSVAALLGFSGLAPRPVPRIEDVVLAKSRVDIPSALASFTRDDAATRIRHTYGKGFRDLVRGFAGDFSPAPDLVSTPRDEAEIEAVLSFAEANRIAVIPFGGGTSVCGGVEADFGEAGERFSGVVSLDLRAMDRVLEVDATSRAARIQAGATGPRLESQLAPHGLTLRHFPQSFEFSTLGGWIVTRAGGHFATVYTHIDDLVESVRMITPRGAWESRRLPASGAGPSPDRVVLGSEGILGVVTEAWMRVFARPRFRASASVHFARFDDAVEATRRIAQSGLFPSNCRLLDQSEAALNFVTGKGNEEGSHVLILGFESADHPCDAAIECAVAIAVEHSGRVPRGIVKRGEKTSDASAASSWRSAFLEAPYLQSALVSMGAVVDTFETACTWNRFPALHAAVTEAVRIAMVRVCGEGRISCRFTHVYPDGPAPYYTFIAPGRAGEQIAQWWEIKRAASDALLANGATITHHHAVGRLHRPWYEAERPPLFGAALRAVKETLDPHAVLNPGVLLAAHSAREPSR